MNIFDSWIAKSPIAHRGLFDETTPENSLLAIKKAIKNKVAVELDVTSLADGTIVVFHDEKLARMTGKDGFISSCNYDDISKYTLLGTKEKIPTLEEALKLIDGKIPVMIEIKNFGKVGAVEKAVWKLLQDYSGEYAVVSFNPYTLEWFKKNAPKVKRGQMASFFQDKEITGVSRFSLKRMKLNKKISEPHFIIYSHENMPNKYVKKYYGILPILTCAKSADDEIKLSGIVNNFLFDGYLPKQIFSESKVQKQA